MPRINIEDGLRVDPDFLALADEIGRLEAFGALICLWELGMSYWKKNKTLIPLSVFERVRFRSELVRFSFAVTSDLGAYCRGANENWNFLLAQSENGKASAKARKAKYGTAIPQKATNFPEPKPNKTEPSSSSSSSSSSSKSNTAFEDQFDPRWPVYEESLGKILKGVHLRKIVFYKSGLLKHFNNVEELREHCNSYLVSLRKANKDETTESQESHSLFNKLRRDLKEWSFHS